MKKLFFFLFLLPFFAKAQQNITARQLTATYRFNLPRLASDPVSSIFNGTGYYNTTTNKLRVRENGAWVDWISAGGGGSNWTLASGHVSRASGGYGFGTSTITYHLNINGTNGTGVGVAVQALNTSGDVGYYASGSHASGNLFAMQTALTTPGIAIIQHENASTSNAAISRLTLFSRAAAGGIGSTEILLTHFGGDWFFGSQRDNTFKIGFGGSNLNGSTSALDISSAGVVSNPIGLNVGTSTSLASALVNIVSTTKGFLAPRMTTTQMNAISSPAEGLLIYNTTTASYHFRDASAWVDMNGSIVFSGTYFGGGGTSGSPITLVVVTASGTYTPTSSNGANMSSSTPSVSEYTRVGNIVSVTGTISVTVSAGASSVELTLPVASNFTASTQAHGVVASQSGASSVALYLLSSNGTSDQINISFTGATAETFTITYTYKYSVL